MFEIGSSLREARERQEITLPQVEAGTKIRGKYLRALEEERFDQLPAETYVKGFLRTYAEYLGLDGQLYVDEYNSRYVATVEEPPIRARRTVRTRRARRMQSGGLAARAARRRRLALDAEGRDQGDPARNAVDRPARRPEDVAPLRARRRADRPGRPLEPAARPRRHEALRDEAALDQHRDAREPSHHGRREAVRRAAGTAAVRRERARHRSCVASWS